ncbi:MAG: hypothetical protein HY708_03490 [Ignavibacteriae bacterium]|nr:hypothetical protein [Ignavibacteriota bacterium]
MVRCVGWCSCRALVILLLALCSHGCKNDGTLAPAVTRPRTYRMGFSGIPPSADLPLAIAAIDMWSLRAEAAIMSFELPWDSLLAGVFPESLVVHDQLTFTDLDLVAHPPPPGSILPLFAYLGLVDVNLYPKPALSAWDTAFARPRQ